jgi:hypothetical protein
MDGTRFIDLEDREIRQGAIDTIPHIHGNGIRSVQAQSLKSKFPHHGSGWILLLK